MKVIRYIHEWSSNSNYLVFHTFPMIHIGTRDYYKEVSTSLSEMNEILLEGVPIKGKTEIGSYQKIAKKLGLICQMEGLSIPDDLESVNIDMPGKQFELGLKSLPLKEKILFWRMSNSLKDIPEKYVQEIMNYLREMLCYPESQRVDLIDPKNHYAFKHKKKNRLELLIENERNEVIKDNLAHYIEVNKNKEFRMDIGIVFGEGHMPYIYEQLKQLGYKWKLEKQICVF